MDPVLGLVRDGGTGVASRHDSNGPLSPWTDDQSRCITTSPGPCAPPNHGPLSKKTTTMPGALVEQGLDAAG